MKKLLIPFLIIILISCFLFIGCQEKQEVVLVYGTTEKISDMEPANAYDFHTWEIFQNIYGGLLAYTPGTTDIIPGLAESYTMNDDASEYTFVLRKGLKFTDGTPFNAEAVKWSIDRVIKIGGDPSWMVSDFVDSVEVVDENTVKFKLKGSVAFFPALVASVPYFPVNPKIYPADKFINDPEELTGKVLVGLGAYKVNSFKRDEEIILEANPNYYGAKPKVGKIIIRYFADATTMRLALEKGEIDLAFKTLNPSDISDLSKNANLNMFKLQGPYIRYLCYETSESVFKDKRLRKAIGALIDRPDIMKKVFLDQNSPLYSMIPEGMIYHTDDFKTEIGDANVALAEQLLTEAGFTAEAPFEFDLWYTPTHYGDTEYNMAEVLKTNIEKTPLVKVNIKSSEWATYMDQFDTKQMPAFLLGWYPDYVDPDDYTAAFAGTTGSAGMGIFFSDPKWDELFKEEQTDPKDVVREAVFEKIQKMWTDECPTVPIYQGNLYVFTKKNVKGVKIGATLIFNYSELYYE